MLFNIFDCLRSKRNASNHPAAHFTQTTHSRFSSKLPSPHPQVYRARLRSTDEEVAVKVQRPGALATISKVREKRFRSLRLSVKRRKLSPRAAFDF